MGVAGGGGALAPEGGEGPLPPWRTGAPRDARFPRALVAGPVLDAARGLLGCCLVSTVGGERVIVVVVETEAYEGPDDPASHAATRGGPTRRNRAMFGPAGRAYVYRSYGVHWCVNVVTGREGEGQAVLIRGVEPVEGEAVMARRRDGRTPLGAGPGRVCAALAVDGSLYGHDLRRPPLVLQTGWSLPDAAIGVSRRVGVTKAADRPHRFYVRGSAGVSRPEGWGEPGGETRSRIGGTRRP